VEEGECVRKIVLLVMAVVCLAPVGRAQAPFKVGVSHRAFLKGDTSYDWRGAQTHALLTTVWYPADAQAVETAQWVGDPKQPFASAGRAAEEAALAPSPAKLPLILLSHGTGGSALMMAWLGTQLAAHGYIAIAVNHPGNNALEPYTVQGFTLGWERAVDLSRVLDGMLADPEFGQRIDPHRIGAAGFSFGGFTMIELAGGVADFSHVIAECDVPEPHAAICTSPPELPNLMPRAIQLFHADPTYRAALEASRKSYRDPRIRAIFAIAPLGSVFSPESLEKISIPVEIVAGAGDPILSPPANAGFVAAHIPGAKLTIYPGGVGHYTFLDSCVAAAKKQNPGFCADPPGVDRDAIHLTTAEKAVTFFDRTLTP
jgi:predicted dienelactone hydrolase